MSSDSAVRVEMYTDKIYLTLYSSDFLSVMSASRTIFIINNLYLSQSVLENLQRHLINNNMLTLTRVCGQQCAK